ncbi:hypothetical protein DPMN_005690 [Dreissena polymorpha]|uniref:Uncharacterized protein n=1 Tax=Dreissena polymorpha TaxID=45954 RepID=A0A9D4MQQ8_DREPO|nr:hypothetical protein DPMN_005690 [Dreissena polymorpha]
MCRFFMNCAAMLRPLGKPTGQAHLLNTLPSRGTLSPLRTGTVSSSFRLDFEK